ncbi:MAG: hypothetical protein LBJ18_00665, partial [Rickettsiales bacterium]|nr:hypothetical protein [Rickettsiales bacterium]
MKKLFLLFALCLLPFAFAQAVDFPTGSGPGIMSQFGQIQNVQSYSSNPFYGPNSPYNQRLPVPVYVQGTELNAAECQSVLSSLVAQQCAMKNNCANAKVGDIRPGIMVMLSGLSGHNYVSACSGYLDGAFNDYVAQHSVMQGGAAFPTAANPGDNAPAPEFKIDNPYQIKSKGPWLDGIIERTGELGKLQAQNAEDYNLKPTQMPTTIADVSFSDRMANAAAGYEQWAPVYKQVCDSAGKNCHQACVKNCA